jgi:hypothetical protein
MVKCIDVFCKQEPVYDDLIDPLGWKRIDPLKGYECFRWMPDGGRHGILIAIKKRPEVYSEVYDPKTIDDMVETAKSKGVEVPDELLLKFRRDNLRDDREARTYVVEKEGSGLHDPSTARRVQSNRNYTIRADPELYQLVTEYPHLEDIDPWLKQVFGLARLTQGAPTYEIGLESKEIAPKNILVSMVGLAAYFAKVFDGVIYDDNNNRFGKPDPDELHRQGMELFLAIAEDARTKGREFLDQMKGAKPKKKTDSGVESVNK